MISNSFHDQICTYMMSNKMVLIQNFGTVRGFEIEKRNVRVKSWFQVAKNGVKIDSLGFIFCFDFLSMPLSQESWIYGGMWKALLWTPSTSCSEMYFLPLSCRNYPLIYSSVYRLHVLAMPGRSNTLIFCLIACLHIWKWIPQNMYQHVYETEIKSDEITPGYPQLTTYIILEEGIEFLKNNNVVLHRLNQEIVCLCHLHKQHLKSNLSHMHRTPRDPR